MIIIWIILILIITGLAAWFSGKFNKNLPRWISLIGLLIDFILVLVFWLSESVAINLNSNDNWLVRFNAEWIPQFGISLNFAMDGLSLILVVLTIFLGILSVLTSWKEITERIGFFHFNLL